LAAYPCGLVSASSSAVESRSWDVVTARRLAAFAAGLGIFLLVLYRFEPGFVFLLDDANLLFHEAGHPIFGIFSWQ
jgi:hypothetical protein